MLFPPPFQSVLSWLQPTQNSRLKTQNSKRPLKESRDTLAAPYAECNESVAPADPLLLIESLDGEDHSTGADRVAQRDAAAMGVSFVHRQVKLADHAERLGCKRLIQLNYIHILDRQPCTLHHPAHCGHRPQAHSPGVNAG